MSDDENDVAWRARIPQKKDARFPPRNPSFGPEPGQDFFSLTEKNGRPHGPFERGRVLVYNATAPSKPEPPDRDFK